MVPERAAGVSSASERERQRGRLSLALMRQSRVERCTETTRRWAVFWCGVSLVGAGGCRGASPAPPAQVDGPGSVREEVVEDGPRSGDEGQGEASEAAISDAAAVVSSPTARIEGGRLTSHEVATFELDLTEVTVGAYRACVEAGACTAPEPTYDRGNYHREGYEDHPVTHVRADQAEAFCAWVGKRLPSEWEWQWAAQGGAEARAYPWGDAAPSCELAAYDEPSVSVTEKGCGRHGPWAVGSRPAGASADGVLDLAGNVREWTSSGDGDGKRVVRGGGWFMRASAMRVEARDGVDPGQGSNGVGFRCARSVD